MKRQRCLLLLGLAALMPSAQLAPVRGDDGAGPQPAKKFIRLLHDDKDQPIALQTSIVRYTAARGSSPSVDLIGAIHVGEKAYYQQLNEAFQRYDAVLYELVAPEAKEVPQPDQRAGNPLSAMQLGLKNLLELEFQLDSIDYSQPNLVHADLSPEEFARSMADRGEGVVQMFFRALGQGVALQSKEPEQTSDVQLLAALFSRNRAGQLKRIMARQIDSMGTGTFFDGPEGSTLVTVRNERAMDVLDKQIRDGKKRIAVFYGAAHMADMERQLSRRFRLKPVEEHWLTAWDLAPMPKSAPQRRSDR